MHRIFRQMVRQSFNIIVYKCFDDVARCQGEIVEWKKGTKNCSTIVQFFLRQKIVLKKKKLEGNTPNIIISECHLSGNQEEEPWFASQRSSKDSHDWVRDGRNRSLPGQTLTPPYVAILQWVGEALHIICVLLIMRFKDGFFCLGKKKKKDTFGSLQTISQ